MELKSKNNNVLYITETSTTIILPNNTYNTVIVLATVTNIKMPDPTKSIIGTSIFVRNLTGLSISVQDYDGVELCNTESNKYTWIVLTNEGYVSLHCDHGGPPPSPEWMFKYNIEPPLTLATFAISTSLSTDGNVLAIGWPIDESNFGRVNIYNKVGFVWNLVDYIIPDDSFEYDSFGNSVALNSDGTVLVIGAPNNFLPTEAGSVYIYNYTTTWALTDKITIPGANVGARVGYSVSINADGDIIAFGSPNYNVDTEAGVWVYRLLSGTWTFDQQIYSTSLISGTQFGICVALNAAGDRLLIGDTYYNVTTFNYGAFSVFEYTTSWNLMDASIIPPGLSENNLVGVSGSISGIGDTIAFGSPTTGDGIVWIYKYITGVWSLYQTITPPSSLPTQIGYNTGLDYDGVTLVFNSTYKGEPSPPLIPSFYVYDLVSGVWTFNKNIIAAELIGGNTNSICISPDGHYACMAVNDDVEFAYINLYSNL